LDLLAEDDIYILLIDRLGNVYWRGEGAYSQEKGASLLQAIDRLAESENQFLAVT